MHLPLLIFSSACLRTSKCLSMGEWWMLYLHRMFWVFGSHFMAFVCLIVWFMPLLLLLYLVSLALRDSVDFDFVSQVVWVEWRLRPCGSKKIAKEAQRHPTQTERGQYYGPGNPSKVVKQKRRPNMTSDYHGLSVVVVPMVYGGPLSPGSLCFLAGVRFSSGFYT